MSNLITTETKTRFVVWGCGVWPERGRLIDPEVGEPMDCVTQDMPEFDQLPEEFVAEWAAAPLGSEHWAEVVYAAESDVDGATRFSPNVYGFAEAK